MNNYEEDVETFLIKVKKSKDKDVDSYSSESLIESLLQKGSFFRVDEIIKTGKSKKEQ